MNGWLVLLIAFLAGVFLAGTVKGLISKGTSKAGA